MHMHTEQWLKLKYDGLAPCKRSEYIFISFKIKHFRKINHMYGRAHGDALIEKVYQRITEWVKTDGYVAHLYHGSYSILYHYHDENKDDITFLRLMTSMGEYVYHLEDAYVHDNLFCGLGIYLLNESSDDFYEAQYGAELCRSESKERDFLISHVEIYGSSYHEHGKSAIDYRKLLQPAIQQGHIQPYLQPKVDMKTGEVTHAEALMRWIDPVYGMMPIGEYLPLLEECGLANLVDMFMFESACQWINKWIATYDKKIQISVNLSRNTFVYPLFFSEIREVYEKYHCPKECIEIELLESIILNQLDRVKEVAQEILNFGFGCSLDDFGSGYSSYNVLSEAPLTVLKIDRSMFYDEHNQKERILVSQIVQSAHALGLKVVAEGVETKGYVQFLRDIGCDYIQGFVFYRPMPIQEFEDRFIRNKERVCLADYE